MINLPALAASLTEKGLIDKAFYDMNRDEVEAMCAAVLAAHQPEHEAVPYIRYDMHEPTLVVPSNAADHDFCYSGGDISRMEAECVQVAAMAMRFLEGLPGYQRIQGY